ncbi:DUF551 domain-containing protein [Escherichia coli]|nr:DUF551 domain-containing protein [Escherichia coli]EGF1799831.1 DUF551 domain-containing protein [Escherichia coli]
MTTFTDKELIKEIKERIGSLEVRDNIERRAYEIALASLEAEPVAWTDEEELRDVRKYGFGEIFQCPPDKYADPRRVISLYREPPAVPAVLERLRAIVSDPRALPRRKEWVSGQQYSYVLLENVEAMVDEACRAAMLQGSQPVSQNYKLNKPSGNSPVIPDGWISCSERMPPQDDWILIYSKHGEYMAGQVQGEYVELSDGTLSWLGNALFWMPLPEPPQEVK